MLFHDFYLSPLEAIRPGQEKQPELNGLALADIAYRYKALIYVVRIAESWDRLLSFLDSSQFLRVPLLSNYAKLLEADKLKFPNRKVEPSLQDDFRIAAMVIPYSKVFATENYLAELIKQTGISEEYDCDIYTMRQKQDLLSEITRLVLL